MARMKNLAGHMNEYGDGSDSESESDDYESDDDTDSGLGAGAVAAHDFAALAAASSEPPSAPGALAAKKHTVGKQPFFGRWGSATGLVGALIGRQGLTTTLP